MKKNIIVNYFSALGLILFCLIATLPSCTKEKVPSVVNNNNLDTTTNNIPDTTSNNNVNDSIYVKFRANNSSYAYYYPQDSIRTTYSESPSGVGYFSVDAFERPNSATEIYFSFFTAGLAVASTHDLNDLLSTPDLGPLSYWVVTPTVIHITEAGAFGEYISGNFSGEVQDRTPPNDMISISGSFRLKRTF